MLLHFILGSFGSYKRQIKIKRIEFETVSFSILGTLENLFLGTQVRLA